MKLTAKNRKLQIVALSLFAGFAACKKESDDDADAETTTAPVATETTTDDEEQVVQPGAVLLTLDNAMGSIAFEGQAASAGLRLADNTWTDEHCEETGNATKEAYEGEEDVVWGCLLAVKTDGPDTPRGGVNRVKQIACTIDKAITAGTLTIDGEPHSFKGVIDDECWGADFAAMAAAELPTLVNADGKAEVDMTVTGHTTIPDGWSDVATEWGMAYEIVFGFSADDVTTYKMLLRQDDNFVGASIMSSSTDSDSVEVFAMSIEGLGGADDLANFRYEGRFPYAAWGDGSGYGSRHVRVLVSGAYAGLGGFSRVDSGRGYEAGMYGSDGTATLQSGKVSTFVADSTGIGTKVFQVDAAGAPSGSPSEDGVAGINDFTYEGSAAELASFLVTEVAAFTDAAAWHAAQGPLGYDAVEIGE